MRNQFLRTLCLGAASLTAAPLFYAQQPVPLVSQAPAGKWAIVMHGGAGVIERSSMTPERDAAYRAGLDRAIRAAAKVLDADGPAVDAVEAGLNVLEDDPLFNAGKGAVFTADGKNDLDAAIMDGKTMKAGAVAGVRQTKNPISLAKAVMEKSQFVMLSGAGADQFAASVGLTQVDPSYFFTEERWQALVRTLKQQGLPIPPRPAGTPPPPHPPPNLSHSSKLREPTSGELPASSSVIAQETSLLAPPPVVSPQSASAVSATRRSSVPAPTPPTIPAASLPQALANTSSVLQSLARSALSSSTRTCAYRKPSMT